MQKYKILPCIFLLLLSAYSLPVAAESHVLDMMPAILAASRHLQNQNNSDGDHPRPNGPPYVYVSTISDSEGTPGDWLSVRGERLAYQYNNPAVTVGSLGLTLQYTLTPTQLNFRLPSAAELQSAGVFNYSGSLAVTVTIDYGVDDNGDDRWFTLPVTLTNIPKPVPIPTGLINLNPMGTQEDWVPVVPGGRLRLFCYHLIASDETNLSDLQVTIGSNIVPVVSQKQMSSFTDEEGNLVHDGGYVEFNVPSSIAAGKYQVRIGRKSNNSGWNTVQGTTVEVVRYNDPIYRGLWPTGTMEAIAVQGSFDIFPHVQLRVDNIPPPRLRGAPYAGVYFIDDETHGTMEYGLKELAPGILAFDAKSEMMSSEHPDTLRFQICYTDLFNVEHTSAVIQVNLKLVHKITKYDPYTTPQPQTLYVPTGNYLCINDDGLSDYSMWIEGILPKNNAVNVGGDVYFHPAMGNYRVHIMTDDGTARDIPLVVAPIVPHVNMVEPIQASAGAEVSLGGLKVSIPAHALSSDTTLQMSMFESDLFGEGDPITDDSHAFSIHFTPDVSISAPIQIELPYENIAEGNADDLVAMFLDESTETLDQLPTIVENGIVKITIPAIEYAQSIWPQLTHSPPTYEDAVHAVSKVLPPINSILQSLTVVHSKYAVYPEPTDDYRKIKVISPLEPDKSGYVPPAVAAQILDAAQQAYDLYVHSAHFPKPDGWIKIFTKDLGEVDIDTGLSGYTTSGILGQPNITINNRLLGDHLKTTVAHEFGHAMQRQLNTNLRALWLDEGVANWGAWKLFGPTDDLVHTLENGSSFPKKSLPNTWWIHFNGLDEEEDYATMAFFTWLEREYGTTAIQSLFTTLVHSPSKWDASHATLQQVTGTDIGTIVRHFAESYWLQQEEPTSFVSLPVDSKVFHLNEQTVSFSTHRPSLSSTAVTIGGDSEFLASAQGRDVVIRVNAWSKSEVIVYGYQERGEKNKPVSPHLIKKIYGTDTVKNYKIGKYAGAGGYKMYRVIIVNPTSTEDDVAIVLATPRLISGRSSGSRNGGYPVTYQASGLGSTSGTVVVGGQSVTPISWSDDSVTFTMPQFPDSVGSVAIKVKTKEDAATNSKLFSFN